MPRHILAEAFIHPAIRGKIAGWQHAIVDEVQSAIEGHDVVVIGMAGNPWPAKARKALHTSGQPYKYLSYGSYFSGWRLRNALKMWTGWPTFPMVFVKGTLVGGYKDLQALIERGELTAMLARDH